MKFLISFLLIFLLLNLLISISIYANDEIKIIVNGATSKSSDIRPYIENEKIMVPVRFISENLGAKVDWISSLKLIIITKGKTRITMRENENWATVNILGSSDAKYNMTNKVIFKLGKAFVPLRFISEKLGAYIIWDSTTSSINVTSKQFIYDASGSGAINY